MTERERSFVRVHFFVEQLSVPKRVGCASMVWEHSAYLFVGYGCFFPLFLFKVLFGFDDQLQPHPRMVREYHSPEFFCCPVCGKHAGK